MRVARRFWIQTIPPRQMPMIRNDASVVTVPNAYNDGDVTFNVIAQISSGSVLRGPEV